MFNGFGLKLVKINVFVDLKSTKHPDINFFHINMERAYARYFYIIFYFI